MNDIAKPTTRRSTAQGRSGGDPGKSAKTTKPSAASGQGRVEPEVKTSTPSAESPKATTVSPVGLELLSTEQRAAVETLSLNLARAAMTAQSAIAEAALRQADRPAALNPDPFHIGPAMGEVIGGLATQPDRLMRAQADLYGRFMELWRSAAASATGQTKTASPAPARGDKRFSDPEWSSNPVFDVVKQSYLITSTWLNDLV